MARSAEKMNPVAAPDPEKSFGYQVRRCHRRFDRLLAAYLGPHNIKVGFWYYLRVLWMRDGVTQKYLSDMTNVTENTTVSMIEGMIKGGLVRRERDPTDGRKLRISLTPEGRRLEKELSGYAASINGVATSGIDRADLETCLRVLTRMSENLQQQFEELGAGAG